MFWRNLLHPSSVVKMETGGSSEMLQTTYRTTQCHNPKDHNLNSNSLSVS
jgi:hypothetical protein